MSELKMSSVYRYSRWVIVALVLLGVLSGCALMQPKFEQPEVHLVGMRPLPSTGFEQKFEVQLRLLNPNSVALPLKGVRYTLSMNGYPVASGVTDQLPQVQAYQEAILILPVTTQLVSILRLITDLMGSGRQEINYALEAQIDVGHALIPKVRVAEEGTLSLNSLKITPAKR